MNNPIEKSFKLYRSILKGAKIVPVKNPIYPQIGDLRKINTIPSIYLALAEELPFYQEKLYKALVLTEEIQLGWLSQETPVLKLPRHRVILVALPFWIYLTEDFLQNFTQKVGKLSVDSMTKLLHYAEYTDLNDFETLKPIQVKYIKLVMQYLAPYNTKSLLTFLEKLESAEETPQVVQLNDQVVNALSEYTYLKAATSRRAVKGKNFFAYVEELPDHARLIVYFPQNFIGKRATIKLKGMTVYEGLLETDKIIVENLPLLSDYSFLEEEFDVQV